MNILQTVLKSHPHQSNVRVEPVESAADGTARRIKDLSLFFVSIVILLTLVGFSLFVLTAGCVPEEDRHWATSTLTAVFGGTLGWLIKR